MDKALRSAPPSDGPLLSALPNTLDVPPDLSAAACGGRAAGGVAVSRPVPAGWALEVAFGSDRAKVHRELTKAHRALGKRLGGGSDLVVIRPRGGSVRYRGLIVGLAEPRAIATCLAERAKFGEEVCLVLTPTMVSGALDDERRFRMLSAQ